MPDKTTDGDGTGLASETREVTITVRNDISDADVRAQTKQLAAGTANLVVGNYADTQRQGSVEIAKDGGQNATDPFKVNPNVGADEAKAGAQRAVDEEKETAEMAAATAGTASASEADKDAKAARTPADAKKK